MAVFDMLLEDESTSTGTSSKQFYGCYPVNADTGAVSDLHYLVDVPPSLDLSDSFTDADWWMSVPGGSIDASTSTVTVPDASKLAVTTVQPALVEHRYLSTKHASRHLAETKGNLKVLVVYIEAADAVPTPSAQDIYLSVFENEVSLKWQYYHCSNEQLKLEPTELNVLTVKLDLKVAKNDQIAMVNAAEQAAVSAIQDVTGDSTFGNSRQYADLVLYVVPPGTGNWLAYASLGGGMSVYNDLWGLYLAAQAHEVGHNLGLRHAGDGESQYGDHTGFMGGAIMGVHDTTNFPAMCYNAAHHWQLGWYKETFKATVDPAVPTLVKVIAFSDQDKGVTGFDHVLVQTGQNQDLYMQYNRATGVNADVYDYRDMLVVVSDTGDDGTWIEASLSKDDQAVYERKESSGKTLRIEVCSETQTSNPNKPDYMVVSVGYGNTLCSQVIAGLGSFTMYQNALLEIPIPVQAVVDDGTCRGPSATCASDGQCCSGNCHFNTCGGAYDGVPKSTGDYNLSGDGGAFDRNRGGRKTLRGLKQHQAHQQPFY
jgi:hypothetical protein